MLRTIAALSILAGCARPAPLPSVAAPAPKRAPMAAVDPRTSACAMGDGPACASVGELELACLHGESSVCYAVAEEATDPALADKWLARGCRRDPQPRCQRLEPPVRHTVSISSDDDLPDSSLERLELYRHGLADCHREGGHVAKTRVVALSLSVAGGRTTVVRESLPPSIHECAAYQLAHWSFPGVSGPLSARLIFKPYSLHLESRSRPRQPRAAPIARVVLGAVTATGHSTLAREDVRRRIGSRYLRSLRVCYQRELQRSRQEGRVTIELTVDRSGRVTTAAAATFSTRLGACMERNARRWRFAVPRDKTGKPTMARFSVSLGARLRRD